MLVAVGPNGVIFQNKFVPTVLDSLGCQKHKNFKKIEKFFPGARIRRVFPPKLGFRLCATLNRDKKSYRWVKDSFQVSKSAHFDPRNSFMGSKLAYNTEKVT